MPLLPPFNVERGDNVGGPLGSFGILACPPMVGVARPLWQSWGYSLSFLAGPAGHLLLPPFLPMSHTWCLAFVARPLSRALLSILGLVVTHPADRNTCLPRHAAGHDGSKLQLDMTFRG